MIADVFLQDGHENQFGLFVFSPATQGETRSLQ
jgi:hypothetical protein